MVLKKKCKFRPLYKKFVLLKENVQNRKKLLQFKKQKWEKLIQNYKKKLKLYKKFKLNDPNQYLVFKYPNRIFSYENRYRNTLKEFIKFKLLYVGLSKRFFKKLISITLTKKHKNVNFLFIKIFESRIDVILYRAKFTLSIRNAQQLIFHGKIFVNKKRITIKSYLLKPGDLITIDSKCFKLLEFNIYKTDIWPIPPKHLNINYKTMQILFGIFSKNNFFCYLNLEKVLISYFRR